MRMRVWQLWLSTDWDAIHHAATIYATWSDADTVCESNTTNGDLAGCAFSDTAD